MGGVPSAWTSKLFVDVPEAAQGPQCSVAQGPLVLWWLGGDGRMAEEETTPYQYVSLLPLRGSHGTPDSNYLAAFRAAQGQQHS